MGLTSSLFLSFHSSLSTPTGNFSSPSSFFQASSEAHSHTETHARPFPPEIPLRPATALLCDINRSLVYRDRSNYATISLTHKGRKCAFFATPHFQTDNERPINLPPFFDFVVDAFSARLCYWSGSGGATKFRLAII